MYCTLLINLTEKPVKLTGWGSTNCKDDGKGFRYPWRHIFPTNFKIFRHIQYVNLVDIFRHRTFSKLTFPTYCVFLVDITRQIIKNLSDLAGFFTKFGKLKNLGKYRITVYAMYVTTEQETDRVLHIIQVSEGNYILKFLDK